MSRRVPPSAEALETRAESQAPPHMSSTAPTSTPPPIRSTRAGSMPPPRCKPLIVPGAISSND
jgi:hypothetical protein